jgi:hypothetical protein
MDMLRSTTSRSTGTRQPARTNRPRAPPPDKQRILLHPSAAAPLPPTTPPSSLPQHDQATELEAKLTKINEEVPTRIYNVSGSCAGAGSGDFHYYRQIRRAEQDRLRRMDKEDKDETERREFEVRACSTMGGERYGSRLVSLRTSAAVALGPV